LIASKKDHSEKPDSGCSEDHEEIAGLDHLEEDDFGNSEEGNYGNFGQPDHDHLQEPVLSPPMNQGLYRQGVVERTPSRYSGNVS
jgi:hypothetical protein